MAAKKITKAQRTASKAKPVWVNVQTRYGPADYAAFEALAKNSGRSVAGHQRFITLEYIKAQQAKSAAPGA